jgi:signal peptidase I
MKEKKKREQSFFREYFELLVETAIYVFFVITFIAQSFLIPTSSMEDTLLVGDHLFVNKFIYGDTYFSWEKKILPIKDVDRKDIVVFRFPEDPQKDFVKRVIGKSGERISIRDKKLFINEKPLKENYVYHKDPTIYTKDNTFIMDYIKRDNYVINYIPKGYFFVMGDNRDNSYDSRYWGPLKKSYIKGRPWIVYWSYKAEKGQYLVKGAGNQIKNMINSLLHIFTKTRWKRTLKLIR